jgi:hypothetical protein
MPSSDNALISRQPSHFSCDTTAASIASELAWLLELLVQSAPYAEPALEELDRSLLPGVTALRQPVQARFAGLWSDTLAGCPELLIAADHGACLGDDDPLRLLAWLSTLPRHSSPRYQLLTEAGASRRSVRRRLALLEKDVRLRRAYRDMLAALWDFVRPAWQRRGRASAAAASAAWSRRLARTPSAPAALRLMPPRHPMTRMDREKAAALLERRRRLTVVALYFCM